MVLKASVVFPSFASWTWLVGMEGGVGGDRYHAEHLLWFHPCPRSWALSLHAWAGPLRFGGETAAHVAWLLSLLI